MKSIDRVAAHGEIFREVVDIASCFAEDHRVQVVFHVNDAGDGFQFVFAADLVINLFGEIGADGFGSGADDFIIGAHELFGDGEDLFRHGGGEHQHAFVAGGGGKDLLDVVDESHVEHFVGFIQNGEPELVEHEFAAFHKVDDASGRSNHDVDSLIKFFQLNADELSAVKRGDAERGCSFEGVELLRDLNGEFTGRGEDQRLRVSASACDGVDDGNAERGSFSGSGLSLSDHIFFPFEQQGDREFLNGGGFFKSFLLKSGDHAFGDTECAEFFEIVHGYLLSAVILC